MTASRACRHIAAASLLCALPFTVSGSRAQSTGATGDLWEVIAHTSIKGASIRIPPEKFQVCAAREWTRPPSGDDKSRGCVSSDFEMRGVKATWKSVCKGPPAMTGEGEIYRDSEDDYSGTIHYSSDEGKVVISLSGRRIGECDNPQ